MGIRADNRKRHFSFLIILYDYIRAHKIFGLLEIWFFAIAPGGRHFSGTCVGSKSDLWISGAGL